MFPMFHFLRLDSLVSFVGQAPQVRDGGMDSRGCGDRESDDDFVQSLYDPHHIPSRQNE